MAGPRPWMFTHVTLPKTYYKNWLTRLVFKALKVGSFLLSYLSLIYSSTYFFYLYSILGWALYQSLGDNEDHIQQHSYLYDIISDWEIQAKSTSQQTQLSNGGKKHFIFRPHQYQIGSLMITWFFLLLSWCRFLGFLLNFLGDFSQLMLCCLVIRYIGMFTVFSNKIFVMVWWNLLL